MKRLVCLALVYATALFVVQAAEPPNPQEQQLVVAAIGELRTQQVQIVENQAKLEAKLATIAEAVRIARIYSSRGGN